MIGVQAPETGVLEMGRFVEGKHVVLRRTTVGPQYATTTTKSQHNLTGRSRPIPSLARPGWSLVLSDYDVAGPLSSA
jgi:hypothetical protein